MISTPQVGEIVAASFGYDATFYEFYKVTKTTATGVTLVQVAKEYGDKYGCQVEVSATNVEIGKPFFRKVKNYGSFWSVKISDYKFASATAPTEKIFAETASGWY